MAEEEQKKEASSFEQILQDLDAKGALSAVLSRMKKADDPRAVYANNFNFEPSAWDLKIILGQLDQQASPAKVDWHTAATIPWLQVKLVAYYLQIQVAWYEHNNGRLNLPAFAIPKVLEPPTGDEASDPTNLVWFEIARKIHEASFGT